MSMKEFLLKELRTLSRFENLMICHMFPHLFSHLLEDTAHLFNTQNIFNEGCCL